MRHECNFIKIEKKNPNQGSRHQKNGKKIIKEVKRDKYNDWDKDYDRWLEEEGNW
jgi:hypothetical protein